MTNGQLITDAAGAKPVFLVHGGRRLGFPSMTVLRSYGYTSAVRRVPAAVIEPIPYGGAIGPREGSLFWKVEGGPIYWVDQVGELPNAIWVRRRVPSQEVMDSCHLNAADVVLNDAIEGTRYQEGADLTACTDQTLLDGTLVRSADNDTVHVLQYGDGAYQPVRNPLPTDEILTSHGYRTDRVVTLSAEDFQVYGDGTSWGFREGTILSQSGQAERYLVEQSPTGFIRRRFPNTCTLNLYGYASHNPVQAAPSVFALHAEGPDLPKLCD
ncbi:MAG TPA: hypothetical protein VEY30_13190 [Myxococcaceae bacterium]|nr:hypothetical protein [Myxococcaceae bacterium]